MHFGLRWLFAIAALLASQVLPAQEAVVFLYHRFGEDQHPTTNVRLDAFKQQLALLSKPPYQVIPLRQLLEHLASGTSLPDRAVVLTVDDAYRSVAEQAWPLLREAGLPLTVFVATEPVDRGYTDMMSWEQMRQMAAEGATFANHGASHAYLVVRKQGESEEQWRARVVADIRQGELRLQQELGATGQVLANVFAYPYGEYDSALAAEVKAMGSIAFGQQSGAIGPLSDRLALPRFPVNEAHSGMAEFRTKADSLPMPVTRIEPWDPVSGPVPELTVWLDGSLSQLGSLACYLGDGSRLSPQWLEAGNAFRIKVDSPLRPGRQRLNCTAPGPAGRYHWFSHQWLVR